VEFRVTYLTGVTPANLVLNASYAGPGTAANALYDSGNGVWTAYTSRTIPVVGSYVAFKGDWRTAAGTYAYMFRASFQSAAYTCKFSGALLHKPTTFYECYASIFQDCTAVTAIEDNPIPILTGAAVNLMYALAFWGMSGVTGALPTGFMDTSGLTGAAADMFNSTCYGMSGVTTLPAGFMNTSGMTGAPRVWMFYYACYNMSGVTTLPAGFLDMSGMTGAPANYMFYLACQGMSGVTNAYTFNISSNVTFTAANVDGSLVNAWRGMTNWPGTVMWGTNVLFSAITPNNLTRSIDSSTNIPGYDGFNTNWKAGDDLSSSSSSSS